jgi:hypothetical protein
MQSDRSLLPLLFCARATIRSELRSSPTLMKLERVCLSSPQALPADDEGMMERVHRQVPNALGT